jgi:hypothetical protein
MKFLFKLVLLAALIALGVWLWLIFFPGPEKIIRQRLAKLAQKVSFSASEGNFTRMATAQTIPNYFATNVEVNLDVPGRVAHNFIGRAEITQAVLLSRTTVKGLSVKFPDVNVTVAPDKKSAVADLTVEAAISGQSDVIVQELKVTFQKIEGEWLIVHIETVRTLSWNFFAPTFYSFNFENFKNFLPFGA